MQVLTDPKLLKINRMLCEMDNIYQKMLASRDMSDSIFLTFFTILNLGEGCLQKDIVHRIYTNKKTINTAIKKLEKDGYIKLVKAEQYPNKKIFLTDKGRAYVEKEVIPIIELENKVVRDMSDEDYLNLVNSYQKYIDSFGKHVEEFTKLADN